MSIQLKKWEGFQSAELSRLGTRYFEFLSTEGNVAGGLTGCELRDELEKNKFTIVDMSKLEEWKEKAWKYDELNK